LLEARVTALKQLEEQRYRRVLCYPNGDMREFGKRLCELAHLQITALEFSGHVQINGVRVLGKGHVGIVVKAYRKDKAAAIKVRRTDADRLTMQHEAEMLQTANAVGIAPRLLGTTENLLLMEYVKGPLLPEWIARLHMKQEKQRLRHVLRSVMDQAWQLDRAGLDHGELSNASKHIIVKRKDKPCLVDFETASISRRVANVTSLCRYLLLRSPTARLVETKLGEVREDNLIEALREYKSQRSRESFLNLLTASGI
jgi:putative serine/threonine protein kinase